MNAPDVSPDLMLVKARVNFVGRAGIAVGLILGGSLGAPAAYWFGGLLVTVAILLQAHAAWKAAGEAARRA